MKEQLTQEKIWRKISELNKNEATELLISLYEGSEDEITRINVIKTFKEINLISAKIFTILENCLISDENQIVRSVAAELLIQDYYKEGLKSLSWTLQHDNSPIVIKTFINALKDIEIKDSVFLKEKIFNWLKNLASNIEIVPEEAEFILDIEILFAKGKKNYNIDDKIYKFYKYIRDLSNGEPWLEIKKNRIVSLSFNYFNWRYIKENMDVVGSISKLKNKDLFFITIRKYSSDSNKIINVPESIGTLTHIKRLTLSRNNIQTLPNSIGSLKSLKWLDLSHNNIKKIPESIKQLSSLKWFDLSKNYIQSNPSSLSNFIDSIENFKC